MNITPQENNISDSLDSEEKFMQILTQVDATASLFDKLTLLVQIAAQLKCETNNRDRKIAKIKARLKLSRGDSRKEIKTENATARRMIESITEQYQATDRRMKIVIDRFMVTRKAVLGAVLLHTKALSKATPDESELMRECSLHNDVTQMIEELSDLNHACKYPSVTTRRGRKCA